MVDIIIKSWNALEHSLLTIEYIKKNTTIPHRIFIVDDGSKKKVKAKLKQLANVTLLEHAKNKGPAAAARTGYKSVTTDLFVLMDNDIAVQEGWLEALLQYFKSSDVALVAPLKFSRKYKYPDDSQKSTREVWETMKKNKKSPEKLIHEFLMGKSLKSFREHLVDYNQIKDEKIMAPPGFVSSCCIVARKGAIDNVGGIALPVFKSYGGEDVDLCWRLGKAGFTIIKSAQAYVHHFEHTSVQENNFDYKKSMAKNNEILYNIWGDHVLKQTERLENTLSRKGLYQEYPFIKVFRNIEEHNTATTF